jgi:hypothetical protein
MGVIEIETLSTEKSTNEAVRITRAKYYWFRRVFGLGFLGYLLVPTAVIGWFGIRGFIDYSRAPSGRWLYLMISAGCAVAPIALIGLLAREARKERHAKRRMYGLVKFTLSDSGISGATGDGFAFSNEWSAYSGFYVGTDVIVCRIRDSDRYLKIPTGHMSSHVLQDVRDLLGRHLPDLTQKAYRESPNQSERSAGR